MKILFFVDLHGDMDTLRTLKNKSSNADIVVCAGDISQMELNLPELIQYMDTFNKPVLMIHGNHEDEHGLRDLCDKFPNITFIHKGVHHIENAVFLGYGGDGFSTNDPEFVYVANAFFKPEAKDKERIILVTHGPPHGTVIDNINGDYRGNKSYRKFIEEVKPHVAVSGHLHETSGLHEKINRTFVINPGKDGVFVNI